MPCIHVPEITNGRADGPTACLTVQAEPGQWVRVELDTDLVLEAEVEDGEGVRAIDCQILEGDPVHARITLGNREYSYWGAPGLKLGQLVVVNARGHWKRASVTSLSDVDALLRAPYQIKNALTLLTPERKV